MCLGREVHLVSMAPTADDPQEQALRALLRAQAPSALGDNLALFSIRGHKGSYETVLRDSLPPP